MFFFIDNLSALEITEWEPWLLDAPLDLEALGLNLYSL